MDVRVDIVVLSRNIFYRVRYTALGAGHFVASPCGAGAFGATDEVGGRKAATNKLISFLKIILLYLINIFNQYT